MKVQLKITVEVDPALWVAEYDCDPDEVRQDVRSYFTTHVLNAAAVEHAALTVRVV